MLTSALFSLILVIQLVHYPCFKYISEEAFSASMRFHQKRISFIVIPLMTSELCISFYQLMQNLKLINLIIILIVILIWLSTAFLQVPLHQKLLLRKNEKEIEQLVQTNWIRTLLWSLELILFVGELG